MEERLYHFEIGLPEGFTKPDFLVKIHHGPHTRKEAFRDKYGEIKLPVFLNLKEYEVIEVGMIGDDVSKILFRGRLDETRDLCIVLIPNSGGIWKSKTCWVNVKSDKHSTLDTTRYEKV